MEPRIARHAVASALIGGIIADAAFDRTQLGINVPLAILAILLLVTFLGTDRRPADRLDTWLPILGVLASLGPAIKTDPTVVALDGLLAAGAVAAWSFAVSGLAVTRRTTAAVAMLAVQAATAGALGMLWLLARADAAGIVGRSARNLGRLAPVARGAIIAVPVVLGFGLLLTSADAVFGRALDEALRVPFDMDELVQRGVFAIVAACLVAGPLAIATGGSAAWVARLDLGAESELEPTLDTAPGTAPAGILASGRRGGVTEAVVVVLAVDILFAVFAAVQVVFLFGGRDTLAEIGMTYSDYARQGYFQLVGVVALAGVLLLGAHAIVGRTRAFLAAAVVLLALTAVILASAALRLGLYQGTYGWTELRFFVAASIAWLGISVLLALGMLAAKRMRWLPHGLAMSAASVTLAVSAIGPQAFVIHQNLARVLDGALVAEGGHSGFDIGYGMTLGDDAIPDLVEALALIPATDRPTLLDLLRQRGVELEAEAEASGPLSWNLARVRAREALAHLPAG